MVEPFQVVFFFWGGKWHLGNRLQLESHGQGSNRIPESSSSLALSFDCIARNFWRMGYHSTINSNGLIPHLKWTKRPTIAARENHQPFWTLKWNWSYAAQCTHWIVSRLIISPFEQPIVCWDIQLNQISPWKYCDWGWKQSVATLGLRPSYLNLVFLCFCFWNHWLDDPSVKFANMLICHTAGVCVLFGMIHRH